MTQNLGINEKAVDEMKNIGHISQMNYEKITKNSK